MNNTKRDMKFLRIMSLQGPNIWTYRPVLEVWVDIGELEESPSNTIPGFTDRLIAWLPSLIEHRCSIGERGGFIQRLRDGTWPAHILEHVTLELQNLAGMPGGFGKAREMDTRGVYKVVVRAWHEDVTLASLHHARTLILAAMDDRPFDVAAAIEDLSDLAESRLLGPSTRSIVDAADDRDIPSIRLNAGNLVQLGYGAAQRRIWTAETEHTSAIAETISRDKSLTKQLLKDCGIPIPEGYDVESPAAAWEAAEDIGVPVVVKPCSGNHGRAVFTNLTTREEVEAAYQVALEEESGVIVERFVPGQEHRLLVIGGKLVAAARGEIASVVGDGRSTIEHLVTVQLNADPRRGNTEDHPLNPIRIDSAATLELARQGYTAESVPAAGTHIVIQRIGNVAFDVTDIVHPSTAAMVALAAKIVGLDIAGIDLVVEDISRPVLEQRGAIVEVNAGPGLLMHLKPAEGQPRPVGQAIVEHLFPADASGRIPIVAVSGSTDTTAIARLIAHLVCLNNQRVGLACRNGMFVNRRQVETGNRANWAAAHKLLLNPTVETAVIETSGRELLSEGLAFDRCQIAVLSGIDANEDLAEYAISTDEKRYNVYRTLVDVVLPNGAAVLNAADPQLVAMHDLCDGEVLYFATDASLPVIAEHRAKQGRAVIVDNEEIILAHGASTTQLISLAQLPPMAMATHQLLAGIAAAWALGLDFDLIRAGLQAFTDNQS
ncbi:cyanophycin synthetase [Sulfuriferula thiophila]|uniref:cyanophycin synthetase n=1 Tax=Sulfuriferula thiophila TaxID=1781211 RepID=UPI000F60B41A|nr:cyanophycin synthetase [Sulfuriferula thiophila]